MIAFVSGASSRAKRRKRTPAKRSVALTPKQEALAFEDDPYAKHYRRGASQRCWHKLGVGTRLVPMNAQTGRIVSTRAGLAAKPLVPLIRQVEQDLAPHQRALAVCGEQL